jgi:hypothetical protein
MPAITSEKQANSPFPADEYKNDPRNPALKAKGGEAH